MFENSGDTQALKVIATRLDELATTAKRFAGEVVRSKGDDVLCIFADPPDSVDAATAMLNSKHVNGPEVRVGLHYGRAIAARDDIFGDAVNTAARMLSLAKPGEIVTSEDLVDVLPTDRATQLRFLGTRMLKGKSVPTKLFSMLLDGGDTTRIVWPGKSTLAPHTSGQPAGIEVVIALNGRQIELIDQQSCLIGRAEDCDFRVPDPHVSRRHARLEVQGERALLTDQSSTGTWIIGDASAVVGLRRETYLLSGEGVIRLGLAPEDPGAAPEIRFEVRSR